MSFEGPNLATVAKSAHIWVMKNGTSGAQKTSETVENPPNMTDFTLKSKFCQFSVGPGAYFIFWCLWADFRR